jgi:hypothetical protein
MRRWQAVASCCAVGWRGTTPCVGSVSPVWLKQAVPLPRDADAAFSGSPGLRRGRSRRRRSGVADSTCATGEVSSDAGSASSAAAATSHQLQSLRATGIWPLMWTYDRAAGLDFRSRGGSRGGEISAAQGEGPRRAPPGAEALPRDSGGLGVAWVEVAVMAARR